MIAVLGLLALGASAYTMVGTGATGYWAACLALGWFALLLAAQVGGRALTQFVVWSGLVGCGVWVAAGTHHDPLFWGAAGVLAFAGATMTRDTIWAIRIRLLS